MQKRIDLANQTFGRLTVISFFGSSSNGNALWIEVNINVEINVLLTVPRLQ
ncbi:hypothetical protein FAM3257_03109 [Lacticaseibacillus paracasei]|nr:hypothetical protein FAM3257_03109 [Lacticaseibacillus paracasei]